VTLSDLVSSAGWVALALLVVASVGGRIGRTWWATILLGSAVPILRAFTTVAALLAAALGDYVLAVVGLASVVGITLLRSRGRAHRQRGAAEGRTLRLVTLNLWDQSHDVDTLADEIVGHDADLVLVQELTPQHLRVLEATPAFRRFTWSLIAPRYGAHGIGLWSNYEMAAASLWDLDGIPQVRASLRVPGAPPIAFLGIHNVSPVRKSFRRWRTSMAHLHDEARRAPRPLIMAGDFNGTVDHGPFRALLDSDLRDASSRSWWEGQNTWPNGRWFVPPLIRLDHVLVSSELRVSGYRVGRGRGSDHRPVIVEITFAGRTSPACPAPASSADRPEDGGDLPHPVGAACNLDPSVSSGTTAYDPEPKHRSASAQSDPEE
jgi:endonuclease/exonuclease/phosphatase family metal-dependent hydrolase